MRMTDFIAELLQIKNYQKLLINKSRKYQIKQLQNLDDTCSVADASMEDGESPGPVCKKELNAQYFETKLLEEHERSVEWLMEQLRPS